MNAIISASPKPSPKTGPAFSTDRIHTPQTATTHYVSEFTLAAKDGSSTNAFAEATRILLSWCRNKEQLPDYALRQERHGGDLVTPEAWALHLQHREPSSDYRRFWHIDVSLHRRTNQFDVRVAVSHSLDFGFVGWTPSPPEPSAPNFICDWLGHPNLTLRSGQFPIAALTPQQPKVFQKIKERIGAMTVSPDKADQLARLIFDSNRGLPVLLINGEVNPITFPLAPNNLQQLLLGTCYVVWIPPVFGWGEAWAKHFPEGFDCATNSVRLYQPGAVRTSSYDSVRHRFFRDNDILANGGSVAFIAMIRDGLTRRLLAPRHGRLATCEDVLALRATEVFAQQRAGLHSKDEELALYNSEYNRLLEKTRLDDQLLQEADAELQRTTAELSALRPYAEELAAQLESAKNAPAQTPQITQSELLLRFLCNEAKVIDQLHAIQLLYPDSVQILASAFDSANDVPQFERLDTLRDLLLKLCTDYRDVLAAGGGDQEAFKIFGRNDFTTNEGTLSQSARRRRTFRYKDKDICMLHHLKIGVKESDAQCLRVHFHWDSDAKKIVIGHCGGHLPL